MFFFEDLSFVFFFNENIIAQMNRCFMPTYAILLTAQLNKQHPEQIFVHPSHSLPHFKPTAAALFCWIPFHLVFIRVKNMISKYFPHVFLTFVPV